MRELAVARLLAEVGDLLLDVGEAQRVGVAQHRHHQALLGADGHADVVVVLVDDVVAVDLGVDRREGLAAPRSQALTKNDMKPSLTPCFFSNASL